MCRAPLKISLLSGLPVEILQLQLQITITTHVHRASKSMQLLLKRLKFDIVKPETLTMLNFGES